MSGLFLDLDLDNLNVAFFSFGSRVNHSLAIRFTGLHLAWDWVEIVTKVEMMAFLWSRSVWLAGFGMTQQTRSKLTFYHANGGQAERFRLVNVSSFWVIRIFSWVGVADDFYFFYKATGNPFYLERLQFILSVWAVVAFWYIYVPIHFRHFWIYQDRWLRLNRLYNTSFQILVSLWFKLVAFMKRFAEFGFLRYGKRQNWCAHFSWSFWHRDQRRNINNLFLIINKFALWIQLFV